MTKMDGLKPQGRPTSVAGGRYGPGGRPIRAMGLREVSRALADPELKEATPSLDFGPVDPVADARDHVAPCRCRAIPRLAAFTDTSVHGDPRRRHQVQCPGCGARGPATIHEWSAVVDWCRMSYDAQFPISQFPLFGLAHLSLADARERVTAVRVLLELRKQESKKRRAQGVPGGRGYAERTEAYLGWTIAAASLLKQHRKARQAELEHRASQSRARDRRSLRKQSGRYKSMTYEICFLRGEG